jgi:cardiolipin synthase
LLLLRDVQERWKQTWIKHRRPIIAVVASLGVVGFLLFLAQDQETLLVDSPVAATDPHFPDYMASLVNAPIQSGDSYTVLHNGDETYPAMLAAIDQAKSRISLETYVYSSGEIGGRFAEALVRAAGRGVTVRMVLDPIGSSLSGEHSTLLGKAGVKLSWFNQIRPWTVEETNYRTHRKTLVVDGEIAFTGGMGVADQWLGHAQDEDHWRDTQFKVIGPAVRALEASFYDNWIETGGRSAPALDPEPPPRPTGARSIVLWSNPTVGASNIKLMYLVAIAAARQSIDIQSPYFTLDPSTQWSIDQARARGVRIRILTEGDVTDAMPVKHASRYDYQRLLDAGMEVFEYQPTMMHTKVAIVDGVFSLIGSANFGNRSFELNDELIIGVSDSTLAATLTADFERDLKASKRLDRDTWRHERSFDSKLQEWFWDWFGEIF